MFRLQSEARGEQTALIDEMIGNQKVVQAFGHEKDAMEQFGEINERLRKYSLRAIFFSSITNPSTRFVNSLVYTGVGVTGALAAISGRMTVGQLTAFLSYANQYTCLLYTSKAAMIFVVAIPMLSVVVFGIMIWTMPLYRRVQGALDKVLGLTRENLTGVRVIRAFCLEEQEQTHFREKNERLTDMQKFVGKISGLMNPLTYICLLYTSRCV